MSYYPVERIIAETRNGFLVKWENYPKWCCTIEPRASLSSGCLDALRNPPKPSDSRLASAAQDLLVGIQRKLSSIKKSNGLVIVNFELDIFRWVFHGKGEAIGKSWILCNEKDFERLNLPERWFVGCGKQGLSAAIEFPVRVKPALRMKKVPHLSSVGLPLETVRLYFVTRAVTQ